MKFNGFEVTPLGNATLQVLENKLVVSNIGDSGLDGIQVRTEGWKRATVHLDPLSDLIETKGVVKKTALVKDGLDRVFTESEQIMFYYPPSDKILIGYNSNLTPRGSRFVGTTVRTNPTVPNINVIRNAAVQVSASKITSFTVNSIEGIN